MKRDTHNFDAKETPFVWIAAHNSLLHADHEVMDKYLDGSWEKFEQWIRNTIGSDFRWCIRPVDKRSNRQMIAELVQKDIEENNGFFPDKNSFIERK